MWGMTGRRLGVWMGSPVRDGVVGDDDVGCGMLMQDQGSGAAAAGLQRWCQILVPGWDVGDDGLELGCWYRALVQNLRCCCIPPAQSTHPWAGPDPPSAQTHQASGFLGLGSLPWSPSQPVLSLQPRRHTTTAGPA